MKEQLLEELLDAPWEVQERDGYFSVWGKHLEIAGKIQYRTDANRISRLPELYEMLGDLTMFFKKCLVAWSNGEKYEDFFSGLYFKGEKTPPIQFIEALNLLDKVAKGK